MTARKPDSTSYRPNEREKQRLSDLCADLRLKGYGQYDIAAALGVGQSTVSGHLVRRGIKFQGNQHTSANLSANLPPLGKVPWKDGDMPPMSDDSLEVVGYKLSLPARAVSNSLKHLREINAVVRLAYDVTHALEAEDQTWVDDRRVELNAMQDYLRRMIAVIDDEDLRERARTHHGERDDIQTGPRLVAS